MLVWWDFLICYHASIPPAPSCPRSELTYSYLIWYTFGKMPYYKNRRTVIMPQLCDSWAEPAQDFAEHKQPQGIRTLARTTYPMWRILNPEYTSTWRWALLRTDDALLMRVLQFAVLLFSPKTKQCYDHGDIKHSRLKRFLEQPQAISLLYVASGIRKNRGQRCR